MIFNTISRAEKLSALAALLTACRVHLAGLAPILFTRELVFLVEVLPT